MIQESLLFPYLEGTGFVQRLWATGRRVAPFGDQLPQSTEQILEPGGATPPIELRFVVEGARVVHEDVLGRLETGVLLGEHVGDEAVSLADGWEGDRYALVELEGGERGLIWYALWEGDSQRDRFAAAMDIALERFGAPSTLERTEAAGRAATVLRVGEVAGVRADLMIADAR